MLLDDQVLRELHRAASTAGRRGICVPSKDLEVVASNVGRRRVAQDALFRLADAGRVTRVRRDLVVLPDATGIVNVGLPELVDAIAPRPYLITGGATLERFDLTDQHFFGLSVLVPARVTDLNHRGESAVFYRTEPDSIWGAAPGDGPRVAAPERAIVDVVNHPRYGVSLIQALDAILLAVSRDETFLDRLFDTVRRYGAGAKGHNARSAARRVGLIVERLFDPETAEPYHALIGANPAPVLLRPGGRNSGPVDRKWLVTVNASLTPERVR